MTFRSTPILDARYWVAILLASICGANLGDLFAHDLGLGHVAGLLPLAILFAAILLADRWTSIGSDLFYWLGILTLRTAATNLGDLVTHDLKIAYPLAIAALALLMVVLWLIDRNRHRGVAAEERHRLGGIDLLYWGTMLVAGTLGTAVGDYIADLIGLGTAGIVTLAVVAAMLAGRIKAALADRGSYWVVIVGVRITGTNLGDHFAGRHGFNIGLQTDTALFALLLIAVLLFWPRRVTAPAQAA